MTRWIQDWVGAAGTGGRTIELVEPTSKDPGSTRRLPADAPAAYFTDGASRSDLYAAHDVLRGLPPLDVGDQAVAVLRRGRRPGVVPGRDPEDQSRRSGELALRDPPRQRVAQLLERLRRERRGDAGRDPDDGRLRSRPTQVDPNLITSKALTLFDGTIASGGNRYENNLIALYEFKSGQGTTAFDTSGVDPAADLDAERRRHAGSAAGASTSARGKAQASTTASRKFQQLITATGEYSIEAWVVPGNVTQEDARIVSYSGSTTTRNFTMGQTMYNYDFFGRSSVDRCERHAAAVDGRCRRAPAGFAAARRDDLRPGQRPPHLRERRVHRRPGQRRRRHARRLGQQLRLRARQRGQQQPPVGGRDPPGRDPQPRAERCSRSSRTSRPASARSSSCCSASRT